MAGCRCDPPEREGLSSLIQGAIQSDNPRESTGTDGGRTHAGCVSLRGADGAGDPEWIRGLGVATMVGCCLP
jgi:hypothetical protein